MTLYLPEYPPQLRSREAMGKALDTSTSFVTWSFSNNQCFMLLHRFPVFSSPVRYRTVTPYGKTTICLALLGTLRSDQRAPPKYREMHIPDDMWRHILPFVVDARYLCMLMRVNRWWRDEVAGAEFVWGRVARYLFFSLKHEDKKPPEGWYATVKRYACLAPPSFSFYDMSRDEYNSLLQGRAVTGLDEYRISLAVIIDTREENSTPRSIFEWSAYAHEVFNNVGEFYLPVFRAGQIPRNVNRQLLNHAHIAMFVTRNFQTACLMCSELFPVSQLCTHNDVRGVQFGDGDAVFHLDAELEITQHDSSIASSFENNTDIALFVYFTLHFKITSDQDDEDTWEESNADIARFFELVIS